MRCEEIFDPNVEKHMCIEARVTILERKFKKDFTLADKELNAKIN